MMHRQIKFRTPVLNDQHSFLRFFYWGFNVNEAETFTPPLKSGIEKTGYQQQYTGLKDKHGQEIYEGDIVERSISGGPQLTKDKVYFDNGSFVIREGEWQKPLSCYCSLDIVGNIYHDSDLIPSTDKPRE